MAWNHAWAKVRVVIYAINIYTHPASPTALDLLKSYETIKKANLALTLHTNNGARACEFAAHSSGCGANEIPLSLKQKATVG